MVKENKTLDEKTASLWLQNTGKEVDENDNTDKVTEEDTEQVTVTGNDTENKVSDKVDQQEKDSGNTLLPNNKEKLTERFELKMSSLQMKKLEEVADKYNKHKSEVMRTAFDYFVDQLKS